VNVDVSERGALNPAEAAAWLGISRTQVYRIIKSGELRARRCGTRLLVPRKALNEYLDCDARPNATNGGPTTKPAAVKTTSDAADAVPD
jgi:excisionase family DNA binding protein